MIRNYLITAIRSLLRQRFFSAVNILGLAVALSIGMAIIMLVADQMSYDRYNSKSERIFQITTIGATSQDGPGEPSSASTMKLRQELLDKYTGIEKVVRLKRGFGNSWVEFENQDVNIPLSGFFADQEVFDFFEYEFQYGNPATALRDPYTVVLTRKAANKLFKEENPVGQTIRVGDLGLYTVTGVLKDTNKKSHIVFESLASMASLKSVLSEGDYQGEMENWTNFTNGWTYILLEEGKSEKDIQQHLEAIYNEHIATVTSPDVFKKKFALQALLDITPGPMLDNAIGPILPWAFVYFLGGLALVILLTSCFNFTNLSIARSLTRAREIGVRKVTGATRWQIFAQFITESVLISFAALIIALGLILILKPLILQLNFARIFRWDLQINYTVYGVFVLFTLVVGVLAGLFPAIVLSGFQPVKVLKSLNTMKFFSQTRLRKVLLVLQFTFSLFFILTLIVIQKQLTLFVRQDLGFNSHKNIMIRVNQASPVLLKNELLKYSNIVSVSAASHLPGMGSSRNVGVKKEIEDNEWTPIAHFLVDEDYLENMKIKLLAGTFYTALDKELNRKSIIINEQAVRKLQFHSTHEALNQEIILQQDSSRRTIIGIVKDYNHHDLFQAIGPMMLLHENEKLSLLQVAYSGSYDGAVKTIEAAWSAVNPGLKVDYKEVEAEINRSHDLFFGDLVKVIGTISVLAILLSCIGLLGMATYTTETRLKEISIRKVLGSSNGELVMLLSRGFTAMLIIAIALGVPLAYGVNNLWLTRIAYHTSLDVAAISIGILILISFGVLTIGSQTLRAAFVKPADKLRRE
jgi:putative ABC transport system permease protein